ncbi:MAG: M48 family metalloprotease [Pseudomonadota bacterium]
MLRPFRALILALSAALAVSACAPTAQNTRVSLAEEQRRGQQMVQQMEAKGVIMKDRNLNAYLNNVMNRVAKSRPPGSVALRSFIVKDADVNAFTTGGGYVFFNAGLLAAMENEAQVAAVMAHEIAHIDRGHVQAGQANRQAVQIGAALAQIGAAAVGIGGGLTNTLIGVGAQGAASNFSRTQERDADSVGVQYLSRAGYNAVAGAESFVVLRRLYGERDGVGALFASHPNPGERHASQVQQARQLGSTKGRIGKQTHDRATRKIRREVLAFYEKNGRDREAAQIRKNLR